jgi:hypothetical protein
MAVMGQLGNGCKVSVKDESVKDESVKDESVKELFISSGQVLGTSSLVASSQLFSNEGLDTRF